MTVSPNQLERAAETCMHACMRDPVVCAGLFFLSAAGERRRYASSDGRFRALHRARVTDAGVTDIAYISIETT